MEAPSPGSFRIGSLLLTPEGQSLLPDAPTVLRFPLPGRPASVPGRPLALWHDREGAATVLALDGESLRFGFDPARAGRDILNEIHAPSYRPVAGRLPIHYHLVPAGLRSWIGRGLALLQKPAAFPAPADEPAADAIRRLVLAALRWAGGGGVLTPLPFWPDGKRAAVLLTHDLDSAEGLGRIGEFRAIERDHGFPAAWFVVSDHYPIPWKFLEAAVADGGEAGSHGHRHDGRTPFLPEPEIRRRLDACRRLLSPLHARVFRLDSKARSPALWRILPEFFDIDSSVPDADHEGGCATWFPFRRGAVSASPDLRGGGTPPLPLDTDDLGPRPAGAGSPRPYSRRVDGYPSILEIPMTLPLDSSLLLAGRTPAGVLAAWRSKLARIRSACGVAVLTTHPEPHFSGSREMRRVYAAFLSELAADKGLWLTTPSRLADHWRKRPPGR